jgi:hypothetical protein
MAVTRDLLGGRYHLEEQIARGGMGEVWRARDEVLERPVAVKLLNDGLADDERAAERFRREALTAAQIFHPNMANVFDYVEESGRPGIVMEFVLSETLAQRLKSGPLEVSQAITITDSVLAALEAAHEAGIVHRDIKPGNILLTPEGIVKVTDFGIARSLSDSSLTQTGTVMGTAHYSAPEQVQGLSATPATDLYSAGVVLYEMLTGDRPFSGDTPLAVAMARLSEDPVPVRERRRNIPEALNAVVMRALARDPKKRFTSAAEMRGALAEAGLEAMDQTAVMAVDPEATVALRPAEPSPVGEPILPPWAGMRLAKWLAPLLVLVLLAWGVVALVTGPTTTKVPTFTNLNQAQAETLARKDRLKVSFTPKYSTAAVGTVLTQDTLAGTIVKNGTPVALTVSRGPAPCCIVPDLAGMTLDKATAALASKSLEVGQITYVTTSSEPNNTVLDQNPSPGATLNPGDRVILTVARPEEHKGKEKHGHD